MDQQAFAKKIEQQSQLEIERIKFQYEELFYMSNGEKKLKPNVTMAQLQAIKDSLIKVLAIYNERNQEEEVLKKENMEFDNKITKTREDLLSFSKQYKVPIPSIFAKLYGIE